MTIIVSTPGHLFTLYSIPSIPYYPRTTETTINRLFPLYSLYVLYTVTAIHSQVSRSSNKIGIRPRIRLQTHELSAPRSSIALDG